MTGSSRVTLVFPDLPFCAAGLRACMAQVPSGNGAVRADLEPLPRGSRSELTPCRVVGDPCSWRGPVLPDPGHWSLVTDHCRLRAAESGHWQ